MHGEVSAAGVEGLYRGARGLDEERINELKAFYGFDKPGLATLCRDAGNYLTFDLGESYFHHQSVMELVISKLPVSISLGVWTFFITYLTCIPLGIAKAVRDGTPSM
jgi:microcin C transport system permease protein